VTTAGNTRCEFQKFLQRLDKRKKSQLQNAVLRIWNQ